MSLEVLSLDSGKFPHDLYVEYMLRKMKKLHFLASYTIILKKCFSKSATTTSTNTNWPDQVASSFLLYADTDNCTEKLC